TFLGYSMPRFSFRMAVSMLLPIATVGLSVATGAEPTVGLRVYPERIVLTTVRDLQGVVIQKTFPDGSTKDVTASAALSISDPAVARVEGTTLTPLADGKAELRIDVEGLHTSVPIDVERSSEEPPLRFRNDVLPVLTRAGCNTGKCHGSASGKDGFR